MGQSRTMNKRNEKKIRKRVNTCDNPNKVKIEDDFL